MYRVLTANIFGCVAFSHLVQRRNSQALGIPAFSHSFLRPARRAAARWNGVEPRRQAVLGYLSRSRDGFDSDVASLPDPLIPRERFWILRTRDLAPDLASSN
ncbi:hypothetical protein AYJ54_01325 [Bradyrhizobium centrolobii]|uniref:Uncharacterized protein n=1 Tax=Bradyrhizobium centrolobii TaxID=1505087 RepID=A0A176YI39_9BRAD|nr:hypothetical protein AYJ54_01325 [Bradyrhizobium centrolobii]